MPQLPYADVLKQYDRAVAFGETRSLPEYSQHLNDLFNTDTYSQGLRDGTWRRASTRFDEAIKDSPIGDVFGGAGEVVGSAFGHPEEGRKVGEGTPRALLQTAPMYALGPEAGLPATAAALGLTGTLFGAQTYADTGSAKAAVISGATAALLPKIGQGAGNLGARMFGGVARAGEIPTLTGMQPFSGVVAKTTADSAKVNLGRFFGSQTAQAATNIASSYTQNKIMGGNESLMDAATSPDFLISQLPWTVFDAVHASLHTPPVAEALDKVLVTPKQSTKAPVPEFKTTQTTTDEQAAQVNTLLTKLEGLHADPKSSPDDVANATTELIQSFNQPQDQQAKKEQVQQAAQQDSKVPITVTGRADQISNGNYRVLVDSNSDADKVGDLAGGTYFVNGVEPKYNPETNRMEFQVQPEQLRSATSKLTDQSFGVPKPRPEDQTQPGLPVQEPPVPMDPNDINAQANAIRAKMDRIQQQRMEQYPLALRSPEIQMFPEMGLSAEEAQSLVQKTMVPEPVAPVEGQEAPPPVAKPDKLVTAVKTSVAKFEVAQQDKANTETAVNAKPQTSTDVAAVVKDVVAAKTEIPKAVESGATGSQAVNEQILKENTPKVDEATEKMNAVRKRLKNLAGKDRDQAIDVGSKLIDMFVQQATLRPKDEGSITQVGKILRKALGMGEVQDRGQTKQEFDEEVEVGKGEGKSTDEKWIPQVAVILYKWKEGFWGEPPDPGKLSAALKRAEYVNTNLKGSETVLSYKDEGGNRVKFATQEEANKYLAEHPELVNDKWGVESSDAKRKLRFFIGKRPGPNVSTDVTLGEGTTTFGDSMSSDVRDLPTGKRPGVSDKDLLKTASSLLIDPTEFALENKNNPKISDEEHIDDVTEKLGQYIVAKKLQAEEQFGSGTDGFFNEVNKRLTDLDHPMFEDKAHMAEVLGDVDYWLKEYKSTNRDFTLGSQIPGDDNLARSIGLFDGPAHILDYMIQNKQRFGLLSDIMEAIRNSGILPNIKLQLPGQEGHTPSTWYMRSAIPGVRDGVINVPRIPAEENLNSFIQSMGHEFVHHAETSFSNRSDDQALAYGKARTQALEALRTTSAVPKKVRQTVALALRDGDLQTLRETTPEGDAAVKAKWAKSLGKENLPYWSYVYSMLSEKEMMANMFTDKRMSEIALNTKMKGDGGILDTVMTFLSKAFNRFGLGGKGPDNVLSHMLSQFDNYLVSGLLNKTYDANSFIRDSLVNSYGTRPEGLASRMQTIDRTFARGSLEASITGFKRETTANILPTTADLNGRTTPIPELETALRTGTTDDVFKQTMGLLATDLPYHQELLRRMQQDVALTNQVKEQVQNGTVAGTVPKVYDDNMAQSRAKISAMSKAMAKQALALDRFNQLNNFDPEGWERNLSDQILGTARNVEPPEEVPDAANVRSLVAQERLSGKGINPLWKWLGLTPHLKEIYPETKPVINGVYQQQGIAHENMVLLNGALTFNPDTGKFDKGILKQLQKVFGNSTLTEAASNLFRFQNKEKSMSLLDFKEQFVKQTLSVFNERDRAAIQQTLQSFAQRHMAWANTILPDQMSKINRDNTGSLLMGLEPKMLPEQARKISQSIYGALDALQKPETAPVGQQALQQLSQQLSPQAFLPALQHAQQLGQKTAAWLANVQAKPGFTTEQRMGKDQLVLQGPKGTVTRLSGDREKLQNDQKPYTDAGYKVLDYIAAEDQNKRSYGMSEDFLQQLDQMDAQNEQIVSGILKDQPELLQQILPRIQRGQDLRASLAAASPLPAVSRKFSEGRETINMVDNANQFYFRMNNWLRNKATRAQTGLDMLHPELVGNTPLTNLMQQHVSNFLTPDNPVASKITKALYFYKLAFDAGQAMLWSTQNLTTGMASLIGETGGVKDAFGYWGGAVKEITQHTVTRKWSSPEIANVIERAGKQGILGMASWSDFINDSANTLFDTAAGPLAKAFSPVKNAAFKMTDVATKLNDSVGLLSAFQLYRDRGMSFDDAYSAALDVKARGHFSGGKAQRPIGAWSIQTKPVPQMLLALKSYSLGWFSQLAEQYTKGFGTPPAGLTETQRVGAKKAFVYSMVAQAALAGVLGLPGVGQGIALVNQATGLDLKGWLRQNLAGLFDEDQTYGGVMTGLALRGFGSAGLPFDPSSRASIDIPFTGVDSSKGFSVANLGGSMFSTLGSFVEGAEKMVAGNPQGAEELLPNAIKRPYNLYLGEGDIRDARGGLQMELSPSERFMMAIGVTPSRVQTQRDISEGVKKANLNVQKERESFEDETASQIRQGNVPEAKTNVAKYVAAHPETQADELIRQIASRVEAQEFPFDPRRTAQPGVDLSGFPSEQPGQEVARQRTREAVQRAFGVVPKSNLRGQIKAGQEDQAMTDDPTLGRQEAGRQFPSSGGRAIQPDRGPYSWLLNGQTPGVFQAPSARWVQ